MFGRSDGAWSLQSKLIPDSSGGYDYVGGFHSMDVKANVLVLGDSLSSYSKGNSSNGC